jgi:hypothetical protein
MKKALNIFQGFFYLNNVKSYFTKGTAMRVLPQPKNIWTPLSAFSNVIEKASSESSSDFTGTFNRATSFSGL